MSYCIPTQIHLHGIYLTGNHSPNQHPRAHVYARLYSGDQHVGGYLSAVRYNAERDHSSITNLHQHVTDEETIRLLAISFQLSSKRLSKNIASTSLRLQEPIVFAALGPLHGDCGVEFGTRHSQIVFQIVQSCLSDCISIDVV